MRWTLKTPATVLPIETGGLLRALNLDAGDGCSPEDAFYIQGLVRKATALIEARANRQFITAEWLVYGDCVPRARDVLEFPGRLPLQSVESIRYAQASDGEWTDWAAENFQVDAVDPDRPGRVQPVKGQTWPSVSDQMSAVEYSLKCGYGDTADAVPEEVQAAVYSVCAELFTVREPVSTLKLERVPEGVLDLAVELVSWGNYPA